MVNFLKFCGSGNCGTAQLPRRNCTETNSRAAFKGLNHISKMERELPNYQNFCRGCGTASFLRRLCCRDHVNVVDMQKYECVKDGSKWETLKFKSSIMRKRKKEQNRFNILYCEVFTCNAYIVFILFWAFFINFK